jgi:hypothetical protein
MSNDRTPKGKNRDAHGRFLPGHTLPGPGNPLGKRIAKLRTALVDAVSEDDIRAIITKLVSLAKDGDMIAARILFDRVLGRPIESDLLARIEDLEEQLGGKA